MLFVLLRWGDCNGLETILDMGADVDSTFRLGGGNRPALALAVERGYTKLVELMCQRHCSVQVGSILKVLPFGYQELIVVLSHNVGTF